MKANKDYRFIVSQEELNYTYNSAQRRMEAWPDIAYKYKKVIENCSYFSSEKEALEYALGMIKKHKSDMQIWVSIDKTENSIRVGRRWIATDDVKVKVAAEYIGMVLMYDDTRLLHIISGEATIEDVISYY